MKDDLWKKFVATGAVVDYLNYKQQDRENNYDADANKGIDNKRTDSWGE